MKSGELPDNEAITLAGLHGCEFKRAANNLWYIGTALGAAGHPVEEKNLTQNGTYGFASCEKLAQAYCDFYKLGDQYAPD